jgi:cell volume regulation protein A
VAVEFSLQMLVGAVIGVLGGRLLLAFMRRVALPSEALYPLRTFAGGFAIFGLATELHGSGFLAIFVAGILMGDERAPYKGEIERFVAALASLGEIVAFLILGFTVDLGTLARSDVWVPGLILAVALAFVVRPVLVGLTLLPTDLRRNERAFVLWAGLKGAVPILLGSFLLTATVPDAERLYGIIIVVVACSVLVQGGLVPTVARRLGVPMHTVQPEPWALGVRLRDEPEGFHRFVVASGAPADGSALRDLPLDFNDMWVSLVIRSGTLVRVRGDTALKAGDDVLVLADPRHRDELSAVFTERVGRQFGDGAARKP